MTTRALLFSLHDKQISDISSDTVPVPALTLGFPCLATSNQGRQTLHLSTARSRVLKQHTHTTYKSTCSPPLPQQHNYCKSYP